jgi:hypothetical protein
VCYVVVRFGWLEIGENRRNAPLGSVLFTLTKIAIRQAIPQITAQIDLALLAKFNAFGFQKRSL